MAVVVIVAVAFAVALAFAVAFAVDYRDVKKQLPMCLICCGSSTA